MESYEIKNAIITSARFDTERGLSAWITLDYGGSGQGFGGYLLYAPEGWAAHKHAGNFAGHFIWRVLEIADVEDWSKLVGRTVRAKTNHTKVEAIGHIVKENWFYPALEFQKLSAPFNKDAA